MTLSTIDKTKIKTFIFDNPKVLRLVCEQEYDILQFIPDDRFRDKDFNEIINIVYSTYRRIRERFAFNNGCLEQFKQQPLFYEILFRGKEITFNFAVTKHESEYVKNRLQGMFGGSTIVYINDYIEEFVGAYMYKYRYENNSFCSLDTSKDKNVITNILALKKDIKDDENMLIQISMLPIDSTWKGKSEEKIKLIRKGKNVLDNTNPIIKFLDKLLGITDNSMNIIDDLAGIKIDKPTEEKQDKDNGKRLYDGLSSDTRQKVKYDGFKTEIRTIIDTKSSDTARALAKGVETAYKDLSKDNTIVMNSKEYKLKSSKRKWNILNRDVMSTQELSQIVRFPDAILQRRFGVRNIKTKQVDAPKPCLDTSSGIRCGLLTLQGKEKYTYFPKDKNYLAMPKFFFAGMGSGKTTELLNYANDVLNSKQSLIDINFVNECEIAYALKEMHQNHIVIDLSDDENLPSLMLPEIKILPTDSTSKRKKKAGNCATEIEYFINSITSSGTDDISTRMSQYLSCAAKIVFIYNDMKIRTVFDILDDEEVRNEWIEKAIESGVYTEDSYEIRKLRKLDEDKSGKLVEGIIDRYSELMKHEVFQLMLDGGDAQFNFIDIMDSGKSISICMPEREFTNKAVKDVIITYLLCRLRLAMIGRDDKDKIVHVLLDEAHHLNKSLGVIENSIAEPRKYGVAFCFCSHYFDQLGDKLKKAVLSVGGHFILLKGVGESIFNELKSKIGDEWTYDDIKSMDDFNSFNMIWIKGQHYMFTTKMLPPLKNDKGELYIK